MFSSSFFRDFDDDPFFNMHRERMRHMDDMYGGMFSGRDQMMAISDGRDDRRQRHGRELDRHQSRGGDIMPSRGAFDPFGFMNSMMSNMHSMMDNSFRQMESMQHNDPNSHSYMQSSVMTYSNTGDGAPKVYQATSSTRQAPGGIKETRKAVRDSETGIEKMSVGRHLSDRGHVVTRERNARTGHMDENQDYFNFDESEAQLFDDEWKQRTSQYAGRQGRHTVDYDPRGQRRAVTNRYRSEQPDAVPRRSSNKMKAIEPARRAERDY